MKTVIFIYLSLSHFLAIAQLPDQTANTINDISRGLKKVFNKKVSFTDSGNIDLSGHWNGVYEGSFRSEVSNKRQLLKYEYHLHLINVGNNKFAGIAESKGTVPITALTLYQKNTGTYMTAFVFIDNVDSLKGTAILIKELFYLSGENEPAWPLKNFYANLSSDNPKMKLEGKLTTQGYTGFELNMKKIEPQIDSFHYQVLEDMFQPKLQIQDVKFISEKNNEAFIGYMGKGKLSFYIRNIGKGPVSSLSIKLYSKNDDPLAITDFISGEVYLKPGAKSIYTANLRAADRILGDNILLGVKGFYAKHSYQVFDSFISIPVKQ
jgi:archaellum component FlaG (FlaF/FlaG flagellin family)